METEKNETVAMELSQWAKEGLQEGGESIKRRKIIARTFNMVLSIWFIFVSNILIYSIFPDFVSKNRQRNNTKLHHQTVCVGSLGNRLSIVWKENSLKSSLTQCIQANVLAAH